MGKTKTSVQRKMFHQHWASQRPDASLKLQIFLSRVCLHSYTVSIRHSVSVTKTLTRAVKHASDMIPRLVPVRCEGHIHLSTRLTDSSKGRQADTERGTVNTPQPSQLAAEPLIHRLHAGIPEMGLITLNACQSHASGATKRRRMKWREWFHHQSSTQLTVWVCVFTLTAEQRSL